MKQERKKNYSLARRNWERFCRNKMAVVGAIVLTIMLLCCIFAPYITPYDPTYIDPPIRDMDPSPEHPLGTDRLGRDIFARIIYGGRMSISIGVISAVGATILGTILGCIAGFYGGMVDKLLVALQEIFSIFPQILLIMLCVSFVGKSVEAMIVIFIITSWSGIMRVVRSRILSLKEEPFVESCRVNGIGSRSIMFHHMLPNTLGPVIVNATLMVAGFMLTEAGLSYLGMGVPETTPTWGNIINAAKRLDIIQNEPMLWIAPGLAICLFVLSINFLGDGLRDALDPSSR